MLRVIRDLTSAIRNLSIAAGHLSSHVNNLSASPSVSADPGWEVVEDECAPYPTLAADLARRSTFRNVEDGPLPTPPACLALSVSVGPDACAHRSCFH